MPRQRQVKDNPGVGLRSSMWGNKPIAPGLDSTKLRNGGFPLQTRKRQKPDEILQREAETYRKKNADYGDSWKKQGEILNVMFPNGVTLKGEEQFTQFFLFVRCLDKMNRIANLQFVAKESLIKSETLQDTWEDLSVYAAMGASTNSGEVDDVGEPPLAI